VHNLRARTGGATAYPLQARHGLFHRAAWRGLYDDEVDQQDRQQGRNDQQQAA